MLTAGSELCHQADVERLFQKITDGRCASTPRHDHPSPILPVAAPPPGDFGTFIRSQMSQQTLMHPTERFVQLHKVLHALDLMYDHVREGNALPPSQVISTKVNPELVDFLG